MDGLVPGLLDGDLETIKVGNTAKAIGLKVQKSIPVSCLKVQKRIPVSTTVHEFV